VGLAWGATSFENYFHSGGGAAKHAYTKKGESWEKGGGFGGKSMSPRRNTIAIEFVRPGGESGDDM